ncbi:MAG: NAD(P)/FAD-dependent oxidoreductase [Methanosarcinales archaeon Met12]|nr:MAG: NAD(P)/FAD-dependent oxidoreductase [Methanosarcinales archaeon Met12]
MKDKYDVIVVGAGPGGSIAAKTAVEHGLDVLLIEKRSEIGDPVRCAEGISKEGLERFIEPDKRWIAAMTKGARIHSPDGTKIEMTEDMAGPEVGYVLERKIFDRVLAKNAAMAGAEVMVKTRATGLIIEDGFVRGIRGEHIGEGFETRSDIVIGADGVESKVGRWAGIDTTLKLSDIESGAQFLMADIDFDPNYCDFYLGNKLAPGGYAWIFPKGKHEANVGLGILGSRSGGMPAIEYLQRFVETHYPDGKILEIVVGGVPVSAPIERTTASGLMLIGDAARMANPITGGGILHAMESGMMAGEVAASVISRGDVSVKALGEYEKRWRSTIGALNERSYKVKELFMNRSDKELNDLAHTIENVDFTELTISGLIGALIKKNPKLFWKIRQLF